MALNSSYMVSINLQEFLVDKVTGLPLAGGYIEFYSDNSRTTPKPVYQLTGTPPDYEYQELPNPLFLSAAGTTVDDNGNYVAVYYYPYNQDDEIEQYYIAVFNSDGVEQYTLQAWPNITSEDNPASNNNNVSNQISNSQFIDVSFYQNQGLNITSTDAVSNKEYLIAPDWKLIVTSSGYFSIDINQIPIEGSLGIETNPPYVLSFNISGGKITKIVLRQVLENNPDIWSSTLGGENGYISGIMLVNSFDGTSHNIEMQYNQSSGSLVPQVITAGNTGAAGYKLLNNTVLLNTGTNTDASDVGSIYIDILLPNNGFFGITSIQVVGLNNNNTTVQYEQETVNRQKDHLFHYYQPLINYKPIRSYLTGWDFPLNPRQLTDNSVPFTFPTTSSYTWDQTIAYQSVLFSMQVTRGSTDNIGKYIITALEDAQFAIVQYLTLPEIIEILSNPLSSQIIFATNQSLLQGTISLYYTTDAQLPSVVASDTTRNCLIKSLNSDGSVNLFNGNWVEILRENSNSATFNTSINVTDEDQTFGFNGWNFLNSNSYSDIQNVTYFAIVVGFSELKQNNTIRIKNCSLVPGYIPTEPAPQTFNEVLNDCKYYFEKSYPTGDYQGKSTVAGARQYNANVYLNGLLLNVFANNFTIIFEKKVQTPVITFFSYLNANVSNAFVAASYLNNELTSGSVSPYTNPAQLVFSDFFTLQALNSNCANYYQKTSKLMLEISSFTAGPTGTMYFQYIIDSRLGY